MWMEHALKAQKLTSNSKQQQLGAQKGTGETPAQVASVSTTNSMNAQKVASASREGILRKGAANNSESRQIMGADEGAEEEEQLDHGAEEQEQLNYDGYEEEGYEGH